MKGNIFYFSWEPAVMEWIQQHLGTIGVEIAGVLSWFGEETMLVAILGYLYWCRNKSLAKQLGTNLVVALVAAPMLKNIVFRIRPYFNHNGIRCLKPIDSTADIYNIRAQGYSFPSGHSTNAATTFGSLAWYIRKRWVICMGILIPLLVGISRVLLGVHYPTDVLAGWGIGYCCAILFSEVQKKVRNNNLLHLVILICAIPGCFYCRTSDYFTALGTMLGFFVAVPFEERFVRFKETGSVLISALRIAGGIAVFEVLNKLLKMPFRKAFLESDVWSAYLVRTIRYGIIIFCMLAVYPLVFDKIRFRKGE